MLLDDLFVLKQLRTNLAEPAMRASTRPLTPALALARLLIASSTMVDERSDSVGFNGAIKFGSDDHFLWWGSILAYLGVFPWLVAENSSSRTLMTRLILGCLDASVDALGLRARFLRQRRSHWILLGYFSRRRFYLFAGTGCICVDEWALLMRYFWFWSGFPLLIGTFIRLNRV